VKVIKQALRAHGTAAAWTHLLDILNGYIILKTRLVM